MNPTVPKTPPETLAGLPGLWTAFAAAARKELIVITRYPVSFIASFGQIFLIIAIFTLAGTMFSDPNSGPDAPGSEAVHGVVIYGFFLFFFLSDSLWTLGNGLREEQIQGTLEALYLTPASKFANLVSRTVNLLTWTMLLSLAGLGLMSWMLGSLPFENPWLALYLFVFSLSGTFGFGFAFAALSLRLRQTAQTMINLLQFGLLILCANFFPFAALPTPLLWVARLIPLAYCVDAFRSTLMGYPPGFPELAPIEVEIIIVTLFGALMPLIGYWLYQREENHARRTGSLSEY